MIFISCNSKELIMRKIILTCLWVLIYFVSVQCQDWKDLLINQDKRIVPEWEPALGAVISWTNKVPKDLIKTIAENDIAYILVASNSEITQVQNQMNDWGIPESNYVIFNQTRGISYPWVRDWGSLSVFDGSGIFSFYDGVYDYPIASLNNTIAYWLCSSGDNCHIEDSSFQQIADYFGVERVDLPFALTGGNAAFDGLGKFYTTEIYIPENLSYGYSLSQAETILQNELGIGNIDIIQNYMSQSIQHIDCLLIFLNPEHILVLKVPPSYPTYNRIENIVSHLKTLTNSFGRPYKISRIETDYWTGGEVASYTNTLILNNNIYVPMYGIPEDADAISTFEDLMPGYNVHGFIHSGGYSWREGDALHCRTKQVHDPQMLRIVHKPLDDTISLREEYEILVYIRDYSNTGLSSKTLNWRIKGEKSWNQNMLMPSGDNYFYTTTISGFIYEDEVEYYITASDNSGRTESSPPGAPVGYYTSFIGAAEGNYQSINSGQWDDGSIWKYFNGSYWTFPGIPPDNSNSNIVYINNNHNITVDSDDLVTGNELLIRSGGTFTIEPGGRATITSLVNNGTLYLNSSAEGIASLMVDAYSGSGVNNIQLYLTGDSESSIWHYIASPLDFLPATIIASDEDETAVVQYREDLVSESFNEGWVTSIGWHYNPSTLSWDWEPDYKWSHLTAGRGYNYISSATKTINIQDQDGRINISDMNDLTLSYTGSEPDLKKHGYNLIGNPFTCGLDWDVVVSNNPGIFQDNGPVEAAIYFTTGNDGTFVVYTPATGETVPEQFADGGDIPPMQGFFIKANKDSYSIDIPSSARIHTSHERYKKGSKIPLVRLQFKYSEMTDETLIAFDNKATLSFNNLYDARKLNVFEDTPYICSSLDGIEYAINTIPFPDNIHFIPLVINVTEDGQYNIKAKQIHKLTGYNVYLLDNYQKVTADLSDNNSYSFASGIGKYTDRFVLFVSNVQTEIPDHIISNKPFNIYTSAGLINVQTLSDDWNGKQGEIKVFDLTGRLISHRRDIAFHRDEIKQFPLKVQTGIYIVQITSGQMGYVSKIFIN